MGKKIFCGTFAKDVRNAGISQSTNERYPHPQFHAGGRHRLCGLALAIAESYREYCQQSLQNYVDAKKRNPRANADYEIAGDGKIFRQVQITDTAEPPLSPVRQNKPFIIMSGAVVGLFLGGAVFLFRLAWSYFRQRTSLPRDEREKPDHFWRWFAVAVFAMIAI